MAQSKEKWSSRRGAYELRLGRWPAQSLKFWPTTWEVLRSTRCTAYTGYAEIQKKRWNNGEEHGVSIPERQTAPWQNATSRRKYLAHNFKWQSPRLQRSQEPEASSHINVCRQEAREMSACMCACSASLSHSCTGCRAQPIKWRPHPHPGLVFSPWLILLKSPMGQSNGDHPSLRQSS